MNRLFPKLLAAALLAATSGLTHAQVNYGGGVYSQNFNTLPGTTDNTANLSWSDNITLPGWYANKPTFSVTAGTLGGSAAAFSPTAAANPNNVGLFSFGTAASTDRALGSRATAAIAGNNPVLYGVRLVNTTAQTLTSFTVSYTGEQWFKSGKTTADNLLVDYQIGATALASGTWTNTAAATFTSPINTATAATVAGNTAANRRGLAVKVTGVSWAPGAELWVRFRDAEDAGDEQALAVDDFFFFAEDDSGLFFNGSTSYVTMGFGATAASLNASSFTVECRFMRTGPGTTASTGTGGVVANPLIAKGVGEADGTNIDANYFLGIDASGKLVADFEQLTATNNGTAYAAGQNFPAVGSSTLLDGVFYHVAATYNTATASWALYVNGVAETVTQVIPTFVGVAPRNDNIQGLGIGTTINSTGARSGFFQGVIDEARIWNVARTAAEILAGKDLEIAAAPGLLARYGFDEANGTTAAGTNAAGGAAPVGTLAGAPLPVWVNAKTFVPNMLPTIALTAPADGSSVISPAAVNFSAEAADSDGTVVKVEFYSGTTKLGEDLTGPSPYTFTWSGAAVGTYALTAVVTDSSGDRVTSAPVGLTVLPNPNQPAVVTPGGPPDNATGIGSSTTLDLALADPENDALTVTYFGRATAPATAGPDFTIATLPDTQFYSEGAATTSGRDATYYAQTQWILENRNSALMPNLAFVSHMGDMVEHGDAIPAEWVVADGAMKLIENPATSLRAHGIPWGTTPGNHDFGTGGGTGSTTNYNQYFGVSRFAGRTYYGGNFGSDNLSSYQLFSAGGLDFIAISLEYNTGAQSAYQPQLDWADALLKANPNRRAIITTHWMINTGNPATFSAQGQNIYDELKDNPNLFLLLGGHVAGEGRRTDVFEGRTVHSILQDYQGRTNGGDGWLRYFILSPANGTITAKTYRVSNPVNPAPGSFETDADSEFVLTYNLQSSASAWIPLGTVNVPGGSSSAPLSWTGLESGKHYEWYATVSDGINTTTTPVRRFSTTPNNAPTVTLDTPATGTTIPLPAAISLTATATDADNNISKVEFFDGGTKLGEDLTAPFSFAWTNAVSGPHVLTAVVTDTTGLGSVSNVVTITVTNPDNFFPSVALTTPADGSSVVAGSSVALAATAGDTDGVVAKVEFYLGTTKLGEDLTAPFGFTWSGGLVGSYTFTAVATDNDGGETTSSPVTITVTPAGAFVTSYSQDFNSLGTTGTQPPQAWTIWNGTTGSSNGTWTNAIPIFGGAATVANSVGTLLRSTAALTVSSAPTANNNAGYNAAHPTIAADRLLATAPTSTNGVALQLELTNTGTEAITAVTVAYDIRRFTTVGTANELPGYWLFYSLDGGLSWTNAAAFNTSLATAGTVLVPNTVGVTSVPATTLSLANQWVVGSTLLLRWVDDNAVATSPDQIVGLDNVAIVATQFVPVIGDAPTIALTSPAANATFLTPANVGFSADAADSDGTIAKVEFFRGTTKLGEDTTGPSPYTFTWTNAPVGSHSLTAKVTDNDGNVVTSTPPVAITVSFAPGSSGALLRGPYLNMPNQNSIVVRWRSSLSSVGRVRFGTAPDNLDQFMDETVAKTNHEVRLTGLTPYTRYYYSVGSAVDTLTPELVETTTFTPGAPAPTAADYTFRTAPNPGTATDTRIWIVGDCGRGTTTQAGGRDAYYSYNGAPSFTGSRIPDLNLQMGDNAYNSGTDTEYQTGYFNMYNNIFRKMPQWSTLGNHDANNGDTNPATNHPYFDMFTFPTAGEAGGVASGTEHYYSFDYGNIHFICLDAQASVTTVDNPATTGTNEDGPMAAWLRQDLASTTATWIIAFWHHPPYSKGSHDSDTEGQMVNMRVRFNPILEAGGVDLLFFGHSHNYERSVLLDGHYGISSTISNAMKFDAGNGSTTGFTTGSSGVIRRAPLFTAQATTAGTVIPPDGAYEKPLTGPRDHFGAVYNTAGMSGLADAGAINHTAMYISYNTVGTVNLDVNGTTLTCTYVQTGGTTPDNFTIIKSGAADTDSDGISDEYEIAYGLNRFSSADAPLDTDGDGLTNAEEFRAGTSPQNAADRPRVAGVTPQPDGSVVVQVATVAGRSYRLEANNAFPAGPWTTVAASVPGTGSIVLVPDPGAAGVPSRIYRVTLLP